MYNVYSQTFPIIINTSPYNCSFVSMDFLVTVVIMAVWNLVGNVAGLALLVVTFIWRQNKFLFYFIG